jgi:hypothetical protein
MILGLAFVPIPNIVTVYEEAVISYLNQHLHEWKGAADRVINFRQYVETTYVGKEAEASAGEARTRKPPLFSHSCWNKFEDVQQGRALTNNHSEGFNSAWNKSLEKNPSLWAVIAAFKREESLASTKMRETARGVDANARPEKVSRKVMRESELAALCRNYGTIPNKDYLRQVSQFFV